MNTERDLLQVLEVDASRLPHNTRVAVNYIKREWDSRGQPTERDALAEFLNRTVNVCTQMEMRYPKIILKRLKQLQRNEWHPLTPLVQ
jgi:hypothetical protein